jgi:hypothetical protein
MNTFLDKEQYAILMTDSLNVLQWNEGIISVCKRQSLFVPTLVVWNRKITAQSHQARVHHIYITGYEGIVFCNEPAATSS